MTSYCYLSQSDLTLLETCPPQFQKIYLQKILEPRHLKYQEKAEWGKSFHLLMQQYNLGLNIENISNENEELLKEVKALITNTKYLWFSPKIKFREAEYQLNYAINNYIFTVIYDLLVLFEDRAIIVDWKTYREPTNQNKIINNWQTKLYLYILAEKMNYSPQQISFDYWFIRSAENIEKYAIAYDNSLHQKTKEELNILLDKLDILINNYQDKNIYFPHHENCIKCPYHNNFGELINDSLLVENKFTSLNNIESVEM